MPRRAVLEAATTEVVIPQGVIMEEAIMEEAIITVEEVRASSLAGHSHSLTTPILTAIIHMVTRIIIPTLIGIPIRTIPMLMTNHRCILNQSNLIPGITVRIPKVTTRMSRAVRAGGQR